jgi:hypothetical protein
MHEGGALPGKHGSTRTLTSRSSEKSESFSFPRSGGGGTLFIDGAQALRRGQKLLPRQRESLPENRGRAQFEPASAPRDALGASALHPPPSREARARLEPRIRPGTSA